MKLDILNLKNQNLKYEQIVINRIEYLFTCTKIHVYTIIIQYAQL